MASYQDPGLARQIVIYLFLLLFFVLIEYSQKIKIGSFGKPNVDNGDNDI